jgi:hypothetical protein
VSSCVCAAWKCGVDAGCSSASEAALDVGAASECGGYQVCKRVFFVSVLLAKRLLYR